MVDLETMGNGANSPIVSIGAASFNRNGVLSMFYRNVDLRSSVASGAHMDPDTVMWWMEQGDAARAALTQTRGVSLNDALISFSSWVQSQGVLNGMWGNGDDFDNVILAQSYQRCEIRAPWSYRHNRCFRTVKALYPKIEVPDVGVGHKADDDAKWQALYLIQLAKKQGVSL